MGCSISLFTSPGKKLSVVVDLSGAVDLSGVGSIIKDLSGSVSEVMDTIIKDLSGVEVIDSIIKDLSGATELVAKDLSAEKNIISDLQYVVSAGVVSVKERLSKRGRSTVQATAV